MNIKEISEKYEVPSDTLRYWERVGVIPPVQRDSRGYIETLIQRI
ncbi:MerR family DNA-binding transcriptional regulator [Virgibacillus necropolis]